MQDYTLLLHQPACYEEETEVQDNLQDDFWLLQQFYKNTHCASLVSLYRAADVSEITNVPSPCGTTQL
jgi:hypothetical protein